MANYRVKASGKGRSRLFDRAVESRQPFACSLKQSLALAVTRQQFHLEYQPIVDSDTRHVVRFEALLRWTHPVHGMVSPADFIPIAEQSGLILPIGLWALEAACVAALTWPGEIGVSVNLSPVQLAQPDLAERIEQILNRTGLPASRLNLEITEGVPLENTAIVHGSMRRLRQNGVQFSLDDFGTAFAGLTYLRRFSFDVLKIDKSFVQDATQTEEARGILAAIQAIATACKLEVVAEGVETEAELALVQRLGCGYAQGYLTGRASRTAVPGSPHVFDGP